VFKATEFKEWMNSTLHLLVINVAYQVARWQ